MTSPPADSAAEFLRGVRSFLPLAISIAAYGVVWGVLAGQAGLSVLDVLLMCGLVFAGASQFVALDMWDTTALPVASIIISVMIVNLRLMLMSATIRPVIAHLPRWRRILAIALISDEQWALAMTEASKGRGSAAYWCSRR
jgi:predicted branched-subunit amino acid permease